MCMLVLTCTYNVYSIKWHNYPNNKIKFHQIIILGKPEGTQIVITSMYGKTQNACREQNMYMNNASGRPLYEDGNGGLCARKAHNTYMWCQIKYGCMLLAGTCRKNVNSHRTCRMVNLI